MGEVKKTIPINIGYKFFIMYENAGVRPFAILFY
jgi:hypothetical protein